MRAMGRSVLTGEVGFSHDKVNEGRSGRAHGLGDSDGSGKGPGRQDSGRALHQGWEVQNFIIANTDRKENITNYRPRRRKVP